MGSRHVMVEGAGDVSPSDKHPGVSDAEYQVWMALYDDLDPDAVLEWLASYQDRPRSDCVAASTAWAILRKMRARGEVLLH